MQLEEVRRPAALEPLDQGALPQRTACGRTGSSACVWANSSSCAIDARRRAGGCGVRGSRGWKASSGTQAGGPTGSTGSSTRCRQRGTSSVAHSCAARKRSQSGAWSRIISEQIVDDSRGWRSRAPHQRLGLVHPVLARPTEAAPRSPSVSFGHAGHFSRVSTNSWRTSGTMPVEVLGASSRRCRSARARRRRRCRAGSPCACGRHQLARVAEARPARSARPPASPCGRRPS